MLSGFELFLDPILIRWPLLPWAYWWRPISEINGWFQTITLILLFCVKIFVGSFDKKYHHLLWELSRLWIQYLLSSGYQISLDRVVHIILTILCPMWSYTELSDSSSFSQSLNWYLLTRKSSTNSIEIWSGEWVALVLHWPSRSAQEPLGNGRYISCGDCPDFGFTKFYRQDRLFANVTEWIPEVQSGNDENGSFWSTGRGVIAMLSMAGLLMAILLVTVFRKQIWNSSSQTQFTPLLKETDMRREIWVWAEPGPSRASGSVKINSFFRQ